MYDRLAKLADNNRVIRAALAAALAGGLAVFGSNAASAEDRVPSPAPSGTVTEWNNPGDPMPTATFAPTVKPTEPTTESPTPTPTETDPGVPTPTVTITETPTSTPTVTVTTPGATETIVTTTAPGQPTPDSPRGMVHTGIEGQRFNISPVHITLGTVAAGLVIFTIGASARRRNDRLEES